MRLYANCLFYNQPLISVRFYWLNFTSRGADSQMLNFEKKLLHMIEIFEFQKVKCIFQRKLSSDIYNSIKTTDKLLVPADKTSNFYKMDT